MGLFGRKYDGSAIRNAAPPQPETLPFMNGPDLLGNPTSGQVYENPRGPMNYNPGPTFKQRLGNFLEGTVNDLMHLRGFQNTALDQRRAMEMYKQQQADTLAQYEAQQRIAAQYRKPDVPAAQRNWEFYKSVLAPQEFERWRVNNVIDPPRFSTVNGVPAMIGGYNPDDQPTSEGGYDYTPGPGGRANQANWKPSGGPATPSPGGFPY